MKKLWFIVATMMSAFILSVAYAKDIHIDIKGGTQTVTPRTEQPVITAEIEGNVCRTKVTDYTGLLAVTVETPDGSTLISETQAVSDSTQFLTDVSGLSQGEYVISYTLEDNTVFSGEFEKN